ncbi:MAG: hypothetical protein KDK89_23540 [Alphaproteobacteria bacterium]|nr:hypothetical protein [Alphaproteobacteria bacterium]
MNDQKRARANKYALSPDALGEIRDCLDLAVDQLNGDMDKDGTRHFVMHLRPALKLAHRRLEAMQ